MRYYEFTEEQSANVREIGYDLKKMEMAVVFKDRDFRYVYKNVSYATAGTVIFSDSLGQAVNRYLVQGGLKFDKVPVGERGPRPPDA